MTINIPTSEPSRKLIVKDGKFDLIFRSLEKIGGAYGLYKVQPPFKNPFPGIIFSQLKQK